jgi:Flp pilus assembly protein TadB
MESLEYLTNTHKPLETRKMCSKKLNQTKLKPSNKTKSENKKEEKPEKREQRMKSLKDSETLSKETLSSREKPKKFLRLTFLIIMVTTFHQITSVLLVVNSCKSITFLKKSLTVIQQVSRTSCKRKSKEQTKNISQDQII